MKQCCLLLIAFAFFSAPAFSQIKIGKKSWMSAYARSIQYADSYSLEEGLDSLTTAKEYSGHTLMDLSANMQPNENIYINATIRIRNDHGGFWGSGASFDIRNLFIRGIIADAIQYQIGDIDYKLTPYTLFNTEEEYSLFSSNAFAAQRDMVYHDRFYSVDNTWRQQGATASFGLSFKKIFKELNSEVFMFRLSSAANNGALERLYGGFHSHLVQSKFLDFHINYVNAFDLRDTGPNDNYFKNPVLTGGFGLHYGTENWQFGLSNEIGRSLIQYQTPADSLELRDYFYDVKLEAVHQASNLEFSLGYKEVGPGFRSIGAQSKRLLFERSPLAFGRYGNDQVNRPSGLFDQMRDASLYNTRLSTDLMSYRPSYGNMEPYGAATPNRKGFYLDAHWENKKEQLAINVGAKMASEVIGQGTASLKNFTSFSGNVTLRAAELIPARKKKANLTLHYWRENTTRDDDSEFVVLDLANQSIGIDLDVEIWKQFDFLAGFQTISSSGNEFVRRNDAFGQIVSFDPYLVDMSESLLAVGLRYRFNERNSLDFHFNRFKYTSELSDLDNYQLNNWTLLFSMKI